MSDLAFARGPRTVCFGGLRIAHDERVLPPREWTTAQSLWATDLLHEAPSGDVLELCAGAGHIGLLAVAPGHRRLVAVEADPVAASYARRNAAAAGLAHRIEVRQARLENAVAPGETFAAIIADPPWVPTENVDTYPHDPSFAIDGGRDGLVVARACLRVLEEHLATGGFAILQLGTPAQAEQLQAEAENRGQLEVAGIRAFPHGTLIHLIRTMEPAAAKA